MNETKKRKLQDAGWRVADSADFIGLTAGEAALIEIRLNLAKHLREVRLREGWTQAAVAANLGSSQSRVAKMEAADLSVSLDLMVNSLLTLGATREDVAWAIGGASEVERGMESRTKAAVG